MHTPRWILKLISEECFSSSLQENHYFRSYEIITKIPVKYQSIVALQFVAMSPTHCLLPLLSNLYTLLCSMSTNHVVYSVGHKWTHKTCLYSKPCQKVQPCNFMAYWVVNGAMRSDYIGGFMVSLWCHISSILFPINFDKPTIVHAWKLVLKYTCTA